MSQMKRNLEPTVRNDERETAGDREHSMEALINAMARVACQGVGLLLVVIGACYAIVVFSTVGGILKNPQGLQAPVEAMAATIHADELKVQVGEVAIAPGHVLALLLLLLWYMFWAWIPLALLGAGGRLLYWTFHMGPKPNRPPRP